ncbi:MAG: ribonuclease III [Lachnospiraceae bacterium]|nr:ribonuclease III [Lachnospiraceae bacterium]
MKLNELEELIAYRFHDPVLLTTAMTHSSYLNEHGLPKEACNERLEYLGDAVLEAVTSEFLYRKYPKEMEGRLSRYRAALVCEESLAESARKLHIGSFLLLGRGMEKTGGRESDALISDAFEALIAALYLDGGLEEARKLIGHYVLKDHEERLILRDAKTFLQEQVQDKGHIITYETLSESGPQHCPLFRAAVLMDGAKIAEGEGSSKKQAEQDAAFRMLRLLKEQHLCI